MQTGLFDVLNAAAFLSSALRSVPTIRLNVAESGEIEIPLSEVLVAIQQAAIQSHTPVASTLVGDQSVLPRTLTVFQGNAFPSPPLAYEPFPLDSAKRPNEN